MGKVEFTIKKMRSSDAKMVSDMGKATKELQIEDGISQYYSEVSIKNALKHKDNVCLVAKVGNILAGFIIANYHPYFKEAYLSDIAVAKEYRNLGIGKKLTEEAKLLLKKRGVNWSWALVQVENKVMQKIFEKNGYKKGKRFYFYYKNGI